MTLTNMIRKTITVNTSTACAFKVFTEQHGTWWPLQTHHIGTQPAQTAVIEPWAGGRWFERASDGSECNWGKVLVWEPPFRLMLAWQISPEWQYDPKLITEVEVRFIAEGSNRTRVELEHRNLDNFGDKASAIRSAFDSEGGWSGLLQRYAAAVGE